MIQYSIYTNATGAIVADYSARVQGLVIASNQRGFAECTGFVPMGLIEAFNLYDAIGLLRLRVCDTSSGAMYDGRVEDIAITGDGVTLTALGFARALSDAPYTALWSKSGSADLQILTLSDTADAWPERYEIDTNNRIRIAPRKNELFSNAGFAAFVGFAIPDDSSRQIVGVSCDITLTTIAGSTAWDLAVQRRDGSWGFLANAYSLAGALGTQTRSVNLSFTACDRVVFRLFYNAAAAVFAGETGTVEAKFTNIRIVTSVANRVNTTLTANRAAGANVTATVGSTARMYVGQQLQISSGNNPSETVTVLSIGSSTQFNATFVNNYVIGNTVQAHVIYGDEIARDLVSTISTINSTQLSNATTLIQSPALDLQDETYEDKIPADILDYLAGIGDNAGNAWEWGVKNDQRLYFRAQGTNARTWYIDVSDLDIRRLLDQLTNSVYAVYQDANNRALRTAPTNNTGSIARYGLTRRTALPVSTTSATQAGLQQATALADGATPAPQSGVTVDRVFDASGARWPLWYVQAGDTVVIRNLPPTLSTTIDRIRVFRLARAEYSFDSDALRMEPETPLPKLDALLAKIAAGVQ